MAEIFGLSKSLPNWLIFWISDILLMKFCSSCSSLRLYKSPREFRETQLSRVFCSPRSKPRGSWMEFCMLPAWSWALLRCGLSAPSAPFRSVSGMLIILTACECLWKKKRFWHYRKPYVFNMKSERRDPGIYCNHIFANHPPPLLTLGSDGARIRAGSTGLFACFTSWNDFDANWLMGIAICIEMVGICLCNFCF